MAAVNPKLNAVTVDLSQSAHVTADEADGAVARGENLGALHGVPVTIKENVDQEGCATTNGVVVFQHIIAKADSPIVANWKRAGAVIIGRTNTPAFSFRLDTVNDLRGRIARGRRRIRRAVRPARGVRAPASRRLRTATISLIGALSRVRLRLAGIRPYWAASRRSTRRRR
jgi:hypothetical protein